MDENLRIGIPSKGRLAEAAEELLHSAGLNFRRQQRSLFARVKELPVNITFLRADDIPTLCGEGALDMGITGSDLVAESGADLETRLALGVGRCRLALCIPEDHPAQTCAELDKNVRVATSFPYVTKNFLGQFGVEPHLVQLSGSIEVMINLGVADAIVDLVETGSTLAANRLRILDEIGNYETILLQNKKCRLPEVADRVVRRLEGVVIARNWRLLEYNIPREKLAAAEAVTPGFKSPTINPLEDSDWCAVRVMVERGKVIDTMEQLEKLGAMAVLETEIKNCRL